MGHFRLTAALSPPIGASAGPVSAERAAGMKTRGVIGAAAAATGSMLLFGIPHPIHLDAPGARAAVETLIASSALVSAGLLLASFRHRRRRSDLLLLTALTALGLTDFVFSALPALVGSDVLSPASGSQGACQALAAVTLTAAAFTPAARLSRAGFGPLRTAGAVATGTIGLAVLAGVIGGEPALGSAPSQTGIGTGGAHPVMLAEAIFAAAVLLIAGAAFLARPDKDARALGTASFLLAAATLQYLVLPEIAPTWVTARDGIRLAAYGVLLAVALSRYVQTHRAVAARALAVERGRIARDLHDGLAQDLAFIALQGQRLSSELGTEHPLTLAARRALAASRGVIIDLSAAEADSTSAALRQVANELTARFGIEIELSVPTGGDRAADDDLAPAQREDVVRIAREAIVNAARHGGAQHVCLMLDQTAGEVRLRVTDDGRGMARESLRARGGYGQQMMRARAEALGGHLLLRPGVRGGLEIEVVFPANRAGVS